MEPDSPPILVVDLEVDFECYTLANYFCRYYAKEVYPFLYSIVDTAVSIHSEHPELGETNSDSLFVDHLYQPELLLPGHLASISGSALGLGLCI